VSEAQPVRASNPGSVLRPDDLLAARAAQLPAAELRALEDLGDRGRRWDALCVET